MLDHILWSDETKINVFHADGGPACLVYLAQTITVTAWLRVRYALCVLATTHTGKSIKTVIILLLTWC